MTNSLNRTITNNAILDPMQGFDSDVFALDQATGRQVLVGRFSSFQLTIRNATEPYMEMNQRIPRLLDGEFQFGWVLERGLVDTAIMEDVFGFSSLGREMRPDRSPRMQLTFEVYAPNLSKEQANGISNSNAERTGEYLTGVNRPLHSTRQTTGRYHLQNCKPDSVTLGVMAGRSVIATRIEGLCEGYQYENLAANNSAVIRAGVTPTVGGSPERTYASIPSLGVTQNNDSLADWSSYFRT